MESVTRFFHGPQKSFFIFGPRGTGKSTWIRQTHPDATLLDFLDPEIYRRYKAYPERLREVVSAIDKLPAVIVIDEIQKVPHVLSMVHLLIEQNKQYQFILTGSSARKLKREGVDLLAGRALLKHMHPFMASELGERFSLIQALQFGMLPLVYGSSDPVSDLNTYLALYMKEEVQLEGLVRHVDEFSRFLEVISFSQGSILNYANIARECYVTGKTIENYVSILDDLLLAFTLPVFTKKAQRQLVSKPKFYYFDAGVYRTIRPKGPLDYPAEISGLTLETLVAQHLRAWLDYSSLSGQLYFWRTKSGLEVDFIVYGEIGFFAIEVKHSKIIHSKDRRGLTEFKRDYPEVTCFILYQGTEIMQVDGITYYPVQTFLIKMRPNIPLG